MIVQTLQQITHWRGPMTNASPLSEDKHQDRYRCFDELAKSERHKIDYQIEFDERNESVAIIAPHGGRIELRTTQIAKAIAGSKYNFYSFTGLRQSGAFEHLHITSVRFDEPQCVHLINKCDIVVAIHGRKDRGDPSTVWLGGRDTALREAIEQQLEAAKFHTKSAKGTGLEGEAPKNICNRGRRQMGVQLELPRTLRDSLASNEVRFKEFVSAIGKAIESCR
jgi:phage replication-related protein YjqB (UPF0714/DUF867 family)